MALYSLLLLSVRSKSQLTGRTYDLYDKRLSAEPEFLSLLLPALAQQSSDGSLANLYAAATALILNAVESALLSKEQLPHRNSSTASLAFANDGFVMGLAFLLKVFINLRDCCHQNTLEGRDRKTFCLERGDFVCREPYTKVSRLARYVLATSGVLSLSLQACQLQALDQDDDFTSLHWFESVSAHYATKKMQLGREDSSSKGGISEWLGRLRGTQQDERQAQNRELAMAQLDSYATEFTLLENTVNCARQLLRQ